MFIGIGIFAFVAILCIVAGAMAMKRSRDYGISDGGDDWGDWLGTRTVAYRDAECVHSNVRLEARSTE
jgi:hypothetical protein